MNKRHLLHVRSNQSVTTSGEITAKLPTSGDVEYGEIAVNYGDGVETLSIRNSNDEIVPFPNIHQMNALALTVANIKDNVGLNDDTTYSSTEPLISGDTTVHNAIDTLARQTSDINNEINYLSGITSGKSTVTFTQTLTSNTNTTKLGTINIDGTDTDLYSVKSPFEYYTNGSGIQAIGVGCNAIGDYSYAEGEDTYAYGEASHAEGGGTAASGDFSHAEGSATKASGDSSHAEGVDTKASGDSSHAEGKSTIAVNEAEHACGKYNVTGSSQIFSVGIGTSETNRKNGMALDTSGNLTVAGTITASGAIYSSDKKLKENINAIFSEDIEKVKNIELKAYNFIADENNTKKYGVIAQDLEEVGLTNLVAEKADGTKGVDYISFLILKIQQLENEIKELKNK